MGTGRGPPAMVLPHLYCGEALGSLALACYCTAESTSTLADLDKIVAP
jgi:hypothetical protein